ncbi:MAG: glycosyltransferase [Muribaculaceae bacterium]|nr:glycosyltransferase [Muribaculaceae bacterium]
MTLDVLISTYGRDGIENVAATTLPRVADVRYVVSWQSPVGEIPVALQRDDIKVVTLDGRGLSRNRNNSIKASTADICLIADDDQIFYPDGLKALIDAFASRPEMDIALVKVDLPVKKQYPSEETPIERGRFPKGYYVQSIEISFRRKSLPPGPWFDTRFGLGAERYLCGEEELMVDELLHAGLNCRFIPIVASAHPDHSTAFSSKALAGVQQACGAVITRLHPLSWPLRVPLKAWRMSRAGAGAFHRVFFNVVRGAFASLFMSRYGYRK